MGKMQLKLSTILWITFFAAGLAGMMAAIARSGNWQAPLVQAPLMLFVTLLALVVAFVFTYLLVFPLTQLIGREEKPGSQSLSDEPVNVGVRPDDMD
jgi:hypothetical protein